MSQVKKLQTGGTTEPAQAASTTSKLKFKVNGKDYDADEQFLLDQFDGVFKNALSTGRAHDSDRDAWKGVYDQFVNQAKGGTYNISSSSGHTYGLNYTGEEGANLGLGEDGHTAHKTKIGKLLGKRYTTDEQRMAAINRGVGDQLISAFQTKESTDKKKAEEDAAKAKQTALDAALGKAGVLGQNFAQYTYGKDWETSADLVKDKYWDKSIKDGARVNQISSYFDAKRKALFDTSLDSYADDLKAKGIDLKGLRERVGKLYTSEGKLLATPKSLKEFNGLTNAWDTMADDENFLTRVVSPEAQAAAKAAGEKAKADAEAKKNAPVAAGKLWTKGGLSYLDKDLKNLAVGYHDGKVYDGGKLWNGAYVHNGRYQDPLTGLYLGGQRTDRTKYVNYYHALEKIPENEPQVKALNDKYQNAVSAYSKTYGDVSNYSTNFDSMDASRNLMHGYKGTLGGAANITGRYKGFNPQAGKITQYYDSKQLDQFGQPVLKNRIRLANGKQFDGRINVDGATQQLQLVDEQGKAISDGDLMKAFKGVTFNAAGAVDGNLDFTPAGQLKSDPNVISGAIRNRVPYNQMGGAVQNLNSDKPANHQTSIKDAYKAATNENYQLSTIDKWELGALGADLAGMVASLSGAGSVVAGGLGVAGTAVQFGTDVARDGLDWGDVGRGVMGLGLDAASVVPGLGAFAKEHKLLRTLGKVGKWIVPALTAAGMAQGAGVVTDLISGKKKLTDLSVDDLRSLTNGIHATIGGTRMVTNKLGTTKADVLRLKNGTNVSLDAKDVSAINGASTPEDKIKISKEIASRVLGKPVDQIELPTGRTLNATWNPKKLISSVEKPAVSKGATILKDKENFQGDSYRDKYMRWAIDKTAQRNPGLLPDIAGRTAPGYAFNEATSNIDNVTKSGGVGQTGLFGDYFRKLRTTPVGSSLGEAIDDARQAAPKGDGPDMDRLIPGGFKRDPSTPMSEGLNHQYLANQASGKKGLDGGKEISNTEVRQRIGGLKGTKASQSAMKKLLSNDFKEGTLGSILQKQIGMALETPNSKGWIKFKEGGVIKADGGVKLPMLTKYNKLYNGLANMGMFDTGSQVPQTQIPGFAPEIEGMGENAPYIPRTIDWNNIAKEQGLVKPTVTATTKPGTTTSIGKEAGVDADPATNPTSPVQNNYRDYTPISELGRALFTRQLNSQIDTRVERPMLTGPTEVLPAVTGNFMAKYAADKSANDMVRSAAIPRTSDGALQSIMQLQAGSNAANIRLQGEAANQEALEKNRMATNQAAAQYAGQRSEIANQNTQTLARATQAERQANNEKMAMMNQPLVDYWKDMNYKMQVRNQENKILDSQIGAIGEQSKLSNLQFGLQNRMQALDTSSVGIKDATQLAELQKQRTALNQESSWINNRFQQYMLQKRKNPNYLAPDDFYNFPGVGVKKDGGKLRAEIENAKSEYKYKKEVVENENDMNEDSAKLTEKRGARVATDIQELIKMALSGKK